MVRRFMFSVVPASVVSRRRVGGSCVGSEWVVSASEIPACRVVPMCQVVPMCAEWFLFSYACRVVPMSVVPVVEISVFGVFVSSSSCVGSSPGSSVSSPASLSPGY